MSDANIWKQLAKERRQLVADLDGLTEADLEAKTSLVGWNAKHLLAHMVTPFLVPTIKFVGSMMRFRGDLDQVNNKYASRLAERPLTELVSTLRDNVDSKWKPPGDGAGLPLTEAVVHGQDLRRALGISYTVPDVTVQLVTEYETAKKTSSLASRADIAHRLSPTSSREQPSQAE